MTVSIYRSSDSGAPALTGAAGGLVNVLDACLVNGYGSKSAAGWTIAYTGSSKRDYKMSGATDYYLSIDDSATLYARATGFESMSALGAGLAKCPTDAQLSGGTYVYKSLVSTAINRPWILAASGDKVFLYVGVGETGSLEQSVVTGRHFFYFGRIASRKNGDDFQFVNIGGKMSNPDGSNTGSLSITNYSEVDGHFIARSYTQIGGSILAGKHTDMLKAGGASTVGAGGVKANAYPDPVTGGILLAPIYIHESAANVTRGVLPGVWAPLHNLPANCGDTFAGSGDLAGKQFVMLNASDGATTGRIALEISSTW